jgi:surface polysaccharide O-acyltransferase-like enzyme
MQVIIITKIGRMVNLKSKTVLSLGVVLIAAAVILGAVQYFGVYNIYGTMDKWYFYGPVAAIGLIGIILVVWKELPGKATTLAKATTAKAAS